MGHDSSTSPFLIQPTPIDARGLSTSVVASDSRARVRTARVRTYSNPTPLVARAALLAMMTTTTFAASARAPIAKQTERRHAKGLSRRVARVSIVAQAVSAPELNTKKSEAIFKAAQDILPGGVNSPVRAFKSVGGQPIVFDKVKDCSAFAGREQVRRLRRLVGSGDLWTRERTSE